MGQGGRGASSGAGLLAAAGGVVPERIYLVRHGRSTFNLDRRIAGWADAPLSPEGRDHARALRMALAGAPLDAIYSSTLRRAADTAAEVARGRGLEVHRVDGLREQSLGALEGRHRDDRDPEARDLWAARRSDPLAALPGGEDFATMRERLEPALRDVLAAHPGGHILIVGHSIANRAMLGALLGHPDERMAAVKLKSRALYRVEVAARTVWRRAVDRPEAEWVDEPLGPQRAGA